MITLLLHGHPRLYELVVPHENTQLTLARQESLIKCPLLREAIPDPLAKTAGPPSWLCLALWGLKLPSAHTQLLSLIWPGMKVAPNKEPALSLSFEHKSSSELCLHEGPGQRQSFLVQVPSYLPEVSLMTSTLITAEAFAMPDAQREA